MQKTQFSIIETGFGSGLNFFNTASYWQNFQSSCRPRYLKKLVYTSIEGYPLRHEDLGQIISKWSTKLALTSELLAVYPAPVKGIYSFQFESIELILIFMRFDQALAEIEPKGKPLFDCLFLDGFAPAKNESMWHPASLRRLSYLCKQGASFSTFTAASKVRQSLFHCGFTVTREKGFGRKREMLAGIMERKKHISYKSKTPWYHHSITKTSLSSPVVIIGGGVAGCATAFALANSGIKSIIIEQSDTIGGTAGSINRCLYSPKLSADFNLSSQFYWHAYHYLQQHLKATPQIQHQQCGVFFIADDPAREKYLLSAYKMLMAFDQDFIWLNEENTKAYTGMAISHSGLFTNYGGWLDGQQLCTHLTNHNLINVQTNTTVTGMTQNQENWLIHTCAEPINTKHTVICSGWAKNLIDSFNLCRLETIKGQTTTISNGQNDNTLKTVLNNGHYLIPGAGNSNDMIVGASFEKFNSQTPQSTITADIENLMAIKDISPELSKSIDEQIKTLGKEKHSSSDYGLRLTTRDHLPLIGPVPDIGFYEENYPQAIKSGRLKNCPDSQYIPGLFVNTAHGSRGVTSSILSGRIINAMINGTYSPLPSPLYEAVHPARFFVRDQLSKK